LKVDNLDSRELMRVREEAEANLAKGLVRKEKRRPMGGSQENKDREGQRARIKSGHGLPHT
jgi:hypothetical protein